MKTDDYDEVYFWQRVKAQSQCFTIYIKMVLGAQKTKSYVLVNLAVFSSNFIAATAIDEASESSKHFKETDLHLRFFY